MLGRHVHPDGQGFLYLVVVMDWVSRAVLAWRLSYTLSAEFCVEVIEAKNTVCCYARSDKQWIADPAGVARRDS